MTKLHRRIYLALILVILLSIAVAAISSSLFLGPPQAYAPADALLALLADRLPPPGAEPAELRGRLVELSETFDLDLAVRDSQRHLLAAAGAEIPAPEQLSGAGDWERRHGDYARWLPIDGDRWLGIGLTLGARREGAHLLVLLSALVALAVGAYPISRRITRRLERLSTGVEAWGRGDLSVRVKPEGKDEVADLAHVFNRAAARIEELIEQQRRVLASASHELRSPLARLRMAVELLAESGAAGAADESPVESKLLEESERDIEELDALIGDILLASRLDARAPLVVEPVDLGDLVANEAERAGAELGAPSSDGRLLIQGESSALRRMVRNLLDNARRYSDDVTISVERGGDSDAWIRITVEDRGPGVPESERERIFEPFYRPATHRESRDGGVGLGLALVRGVAQAHGGAVRYEERADGGSRFVVELAERPPSS